MYTTHHYINGKSVENQKLTMPIVNPATAEPAGTLSLADEGMVALAIESAQQAFPAWSTTPAQTRAQVLFSFRELLVQHTDELAEIVHIEHGKSVSEAKQSISRGIECIEFACGIPHLLQGQYSENVARDIDCYSLRQPLGVCVGITPFNFPVMVPIWSFVYAIACGNTCILKPSPLDPTCSSRMAELASEAGLPDGVFNVLHGDKEVVDALLSHDAVKAVTAVASTPVAKSIYQTAIMNGKRAQTFGGAKNHAILMPDASLELAAAQICQAAFGSAGERCMALSAVTVVGEETADEFIKQIKIEINGLTLGSREFDIGPLISEAHQQRVLGYINSGIEEGAKLIVDGRTDSVQDDLPGYFCGPCCFDEVTTSMKIYQEEIFGPVLSILRVPDFETALKLTNEHQYGNGTAIFTTNGGTARNFAHRVQVGMIGVNVPVPVPASYHRFGGWKQSFFGDIEMHAEQSINFYTHGKSVTVAWPNQGVK